MGILIQKSFLFCTLCLKTPQPVLPYSQVTTKYPHHYSHFTKTSAQAYHTIDQNRTSFIPRGKDIQIYDDRGTSATQLGITGKYDNHYLPLSFRNHHNY